MKKMMLLGNEVEYIDIPANPDKGFNFPFRIIIPKKISDNPDVVYACNLPKNEASNYSTIDELIEKAKDYFDNIDPIMGFLSLGKGNPMIIPFVPRLNDFRPNFLGRDCLDNNIKLSELDEKFKKDIPQYYNLADQHKAMIEEGIECLKDHGIDVDDKIIITGYSEGAKFASHFSLLHPEIIKAVVAGGTGGVMSMPVEELDGYEFEFPTGIKGLKNFDYESFKDIAFFYYIGKEDTSDSAIPNFETYHYKDENGNDCILKDECGNQTALIDENGKQVFKLDENGNYTARFNLFSDNEVNAINKALGTVIQNRFEEQEKIYDSLGLNSTFKIYPGNHITIFDNREIIYKDIDSFLEKQLNKRNQKQK